jgi:hypothetical protein
MDAVGLRGRGVERDLRGEVASMAVRLGRLGWAGRSKAEPAIKTGLATAQSQFRAAPSRRRYRESSVVSQGEADRGRERILPHGRSSSSPTVHSAGRSVAQQDMDLFNTSAKQRNGATMPSNNRMQLTKLSAALWPGRQAWQVGRGRLVPARPGRDAGTASQLIRGVRLT